MREDTTSWLPKILLSSLHKWRKIEWLEAKDTSMMTSIIFSDESTFQFYRYNAKRGAKDDGTNKPSPKYPQRSTFKVISAWEKWSPWFYAEKISMRRLIVIIFKKAYSILRIAISRRLQHDNAIPCTTKVTVDWLDQRNINLLDWLPYIRRVDADIFNCCLIRIKQLHWLIFKFLPF